MVMSIISSPASTSLESLVNAFLLTKITEGKSPRTVEYYGKNLKRFLWYAGHRNFPDDVRLITEWQVRDFLGYVATSTGNGSETSSRRASLTTIRIYWICLTTFFRWCVREGFLEKDPMINIHMKRTPSKVIIPYTQQEIKQMLVVCDYDITHHDAFMGNRNRATVLVLWDSGLRRAEFLAMNLRETDTETGRLRVTGKGQKERVIRIGENARNSILKYLEYRLDNGRQELWLAQDGKPLSANGLSCAIESLKRRAGVRGQGTIHRFRHTFALDFLRLDHNVFNLQYLLGHSDLDMVRRYTATLGMEDALKAHENASPADHLSIR
jgi:integrase/recombinase XerC